MKTLIARFWSCLCLGSLLLVLAGANAAEGKVRLLIVHGGHDFETNQFVKMFQDNPGVTFQVVQHPNAHALLQAEAAKAWDVLVLYDMWQPITDEAKRDFVSRLREGKGLVALHHSIANYQAWPEYEKIVGGRYYLEKTLANGVEKARSTYQHDVTFKVHVVNPQHPVTLGLQDFTITDETYGLFDMGADSQLLLATEAPTSAKDIGWARTYEGTRVVFIQLGHDHLAFENPNYRKLVGQAINWVARK